MKTLLVLGAGRSSGALIGYLLDQATECDWKVIVGDKISAAASNAVGNHERGEAVTCDPDDHDTSLRVMAAADVVISLLPPSLHLKVAKRCLYAGKHLLTASYVTDEMKMLHGDAAKAGLLFLNECGLDPGIDHMSTMEMTNRIRAEGGRIVSFESFTGGLIAPDTAPDNPWRYKFTWNPRNVVTAGQQGDAEFLMDGIHQRVPYGKLFTTTTSFFYEYPGELEGYPNRDSMKYIPLYGLEGVTTMIRGTLRYKGFCLAWNVFVQLGCCLDDTRYMRDVHAMTHLDFINTFLMKGDAPAEERLARQVGIPINGHEMACLRWSGLFTEENIGLDHGTPAEILEHILMKKWRLLDGERDMVVMLHRVGYILGGKKLMQQACMTLTGSEEHTAMATTVGLPLGMAAKLLLEGKIRQRGVAIPIGEEFYVPILHGLASRGVVFTTDRM